MILDVDRKTDDFSFEKRWKSMKTMKIDAQIDDNQAPNKPGVGSAWFKASKQAGRRARLA